MTTYFYNGDDERTRIANIRKEEEWRLIAGHAMGNCAFVKQGYIEPTNIVAIS